METNHYALLETATEKYTQLVDYICKLQNGIEVNPEAVNKLVHSIYKDEIYLIDRLKSTEEMLQKQQEPQQSIKIFEFMSR